jgi:hypothetical protein
MIDLGTVIPGQTLYIPWATFDSNDPSASATMTGLALGDIQVYKQGGTTARASTTGFVLLDTDGTDFAGVTGIHGISIDLSSDATAFFWTAGSRYWVVIASVTVDGATINFVAATFRIGYPGALLDTTISALTSQTSFTLAAGSADASAYVGCLAVIHDRASAVQVCQGYISAYAASTRVVTLGADPGIFTIVGGATTGDNISIFPRVPMYSIQANATNAANLGTAAGNYSATRGLAGTALPAVAAAGAGGLFTRGTGAGQIAQDANGRIDVNIAAISADAPAADNAESFFDGTGYAGTNNVIPTVTALTGHTPQTGDSFARIGATGSGLTTLASAAALSTHDGKLDVVDGIVDDLKARQVVYEEGAIWIDLINGAAGSTDYVNGVSRNPVDNIADANTLSASLGLSRFKLAPANISNILVFAAAQEYQYFDAGGAWIDMGGQSVDGTGFMGCLVLGTSTGSGNFQDVTLSSPTVAGGIFWRCAVAGTVTLSGATTYYFDQCFGAHATPTIDFGAGVANTTVFMQDYNGEINVANLGANGTDVLNLSGSGHLILAASCTGGTVNIRGNWNLTNNGSGITINQDARYELSRILSDSTAFPGASVTEARLAELGAANMPADIDLILADTNELQTDDVPGLIAALNDPTAAAIADQVWEEAIADHSGTSGSTAEALAAAGGAGDPWITTLPGSYTGSQAGKMLSDIITDTAEIGAAGAGLTEAGGDGDHLTEAGGDGDHLTEAGGTGDQLTALATAAALSTHDGKLDTVDTVVDGIQTDLDNATDGLGALKALVDTVDTVVDAVKTKTDSLTFTVAGKADSNVTHVNDAEITGTGVLGDEWGPV